MEIKKIALDTDVLLELSKWTDKTFDDEGLIHKMVEMYNCVLPSRVNALSLEGKDVKLFEDSWLSHITRLPNTNNRIYPNLNDIINLYKAIVAGEVLAFRLPTVEKEFENDEVDKAFVEKYIPAIRIAPDDAPKFFFERDTLAREYIKDKAMPGNDVKTFESYIPHRVRKMAEASLVGIPFIVKRADHYIDVNEGDFVRANAIRNVNIKMGLYQLANSGYTTAVWPTKLHSFMGSIYNVSKGDTRKRSFYFVDSNLRGKDYVPTDKMDDLPQVTKQFRPIDEAGKEYGDFPYVSKNIEDEYSVGRMN